MEEFCFDTKKDIHLFGMRRSGNHAVLSWLFPHYKNKTLFHFNNSALLDNGTIQVSREGITRFPGKDDLLKIFNFEDHPLDLISKNPSISRFDL